MGIYDRQYYQDQSNGGFLSVGSLNGRSMVVILIGINVVAFVLNALFSSPQADGTGPINGLLALSTADATRPWLWFRFLTYGFAHATPGHILGNMIGLFFFGRAAEAVYGPKKFLWMYITAIIAGSLIWFIGAIASGSRGTLVGASGGVAAVVILFCINFPNQKVYLLFLPFVGIPAWLLGVFLVGSDLFGKFGGSASPIAFTVHLVGAAYAWIFFKTRWELSQLVPGAAAEFNFQRLFKSHPKLKVHAPSRNESKHDQLAEKADAVLQKLHQQGEASLTARERKILEDYSRSIKQKR